MSRDLDSIAAGIAMGSDMTAQGRSLVIVGRETEGAIFLVPVPWWSQSAPEFVVAFGLRSRRLTTFDRVGLGIPQGRAPTQGLLHYERSLGWLLRADDPIFSAIDPLVEDALGRMIRERVLPHLSTLDSDRALAEAMLQEGPITNMPRLDLLRLRELLGILGMEEDQAHVDAVLLSSPELGPDEADRRAIEQVHRRLGMWR